MRPVTPANIAALGLLEIARRHLADCEKDLDAREIEMIESCNAVEDARAALIAATELVQEAAQLVQDSDDRVRELTKGVTRTCANRTGQY